jgi:enediyne polyketide synthase
MHVPDEANFGPVQAVAIIGAALRFPGAWDPDSFHELTVSGRRMFRELADETPDGVPPGGDDGDGPAGRASPRAALLDDRLLDGRPHPPGRDDELTGGITARHVLATETAIAALADVPSAGRLVAPGRIGVFIADTPEPGTADVRDWVRHQLRLLIAAEGPVINGPAVNGTVLSGGRLPDRGLPGGGLPGGGRGVLVGSAGVSQPAGMSQPAGADVHELLLGTIDLHGRKHGVTAANGTTPGGLHCSLRAVAAACEALNSGEYDLVLAGGVAKGIGAWTRTRPPAGGCVRVYDASPTGALPGEGCGMVALRRAEDTRAAQVPAYAEIIGWHAAGPASAHAAGLPAAYARAGIDPADVQFIEGHGAATADDDLAELTALLEVLGTSKARARQRCALGSVAANIGDTRAAAGIAALLKTAFAMTADIIPPSTGCIHPNRLLSGGRAPFRFPSAPELWPQTPVQLAAVNSLGTAPYPDAPRSGPVHVVLRRERDPAHRPGRRRKPAVLAVAIGSPLN